MPLPQTPPSELTEPSMPSQVVHRHERPVLAHPLGLEVIGEGVESEEQLALLAREGCTLYQGFLCSPPIGAM